MSTKSLPCSPDSERGLLSSFLIDPSFTASVCLEHRITHEAFHIPAHALIFRHIMEMWVEGRTIDLVTVTERLIEKGSIEHCGGPSFVTSLFTFLPTASNAEAFVEILKERAISRKGAIMCSTFQDRFLTELEGATDLASQFQLASSELCMQEEPVATAKDLIYKVVGTLQDAVENKHAPKGVQTTGLDPLDDALGGGVRGGDYILVTAKTKGGKSILAQNIVEHVSVKHGKPTLTFSLEMKGEDWMQRFLAQVSQSNLTNIRNGWINEREMSSISAFAPKIAGAPIHLRDDLFTLFEITAAIKQAKMRNPELFVVVVDYIQLVSAKREKGDTREMEVATISTILRRLANTLNIAIVVLAQENKMGDARESSRLEQDCSHRIRIEQIPKYDEYRKFVLLLNRYGPPCQFAVRFNGPCLKFEPAPDFNLDELDE